MVPRNDLAQEVPETAERRCQLGLNRNARQHHPSAECGLGGDGPPQRGLADAGLALDGGYRRSIPLDVQESTAGGERSSSRPTNEVWVKSPATTGASSRMAVSRRSEAFLCAASSLSTPNGRPRVGVAGRVPGTEEWSE